MTLRLEAWSDAEARSRQAVLTKFEQQFRYPLGDDWFRIDHGADYLAFFRTLGEPHVIAAVDKGQLLAILVVVRRRGPIPAWYVCALKAAPHAAGRALGSRLLATFERMAPDAPAYGISMNQADGTNRLAKVARRGFHAAATLALFSVGPKGWTSIEPIIAESLGPLSWTHHHGRKDIVLASTARPMPLFHLQHGEAVSSSTRPQHNAERMFCLPTDHALVTTLAGRGVAPTATATVLARHMTDQDWSAVRTSDI